jgi:hypothetical protein
MQNTLATKLHFPYIDEKPSAKVDWLESELRAEKN